MYPITLAPGTVGRDTTLGLQLQPATVRAEIIVEDADGVALAGATVTLAGQTAETDADGLAAFTVRPGSVKLTIEAAGYVTQTSTESIPWPN